MATRKSSTDMSRAPARDSVLPHGRMVRVRAVLRQRAACFRRGPVCSGRRMCAPSASRVPPPRGDGAPGAGRFPPGRVCSLPRGWSSGLDGPRRRAAGYFAAIASIGKPSVHGGQPFKLQQRRTPAGGRRRRTRRARGAPGRRCPPPADSSAQRLRRGSKRPPVRAPFRLAGKPAAHRSPRSRTRPACRQHHFRRRHQRNPRRSGSAASPSGFSRRSRAPGFSAAWPPLHRPPARVPGAARSAQNPRRRRDTPPPPVGWWPPDRRVN